MWCGVVWCIGLRGTDMLQCGETACDAAGRHVSLYVGMGLLALCRGGGMEGAGVWGTFVVWSGAVPGPSEVGQLCLKLFNHYIIMYF